MLPYSYSGWHEYVVLDVAAKSLAKQQLMDQAQELLNRKAAMLERIETEAANRDVGQPNTATNTRAMLGDPNFGGGFMGGFGSGGGFGY
jgi:sensor c-di-GMP phosphodiesterase-like protein